MNVETVHPIHIIPPNGWAGGPTHVLHAGCQCKPRIEDSPATGLTIMHNTWDGRAQKGAPPLS